MLLECKPCGTTMKIPHSCGHRSCPRWRPREWCKSPGTPTPATPGWAAHLRRSAPRLTLQGVGRPVSLV
jgi:hypothetical protein